MGLLGVVRLKWLQNDDSNAHNDNSCHLELPRHAQACPGVRQRPALIALPCL